MLTGDSDGRLISAASTGYPPLAVKPVHLSATSVRIAKRPKRTPYVLRGAFMSDVIAAKCSRWWTDGLHAG